MGEHLLIDPWIYAIGSGIIVALFSQLFVAWIKKGQNEKRRKTYLNTIKRQLETNKETMSTLEKDLAGNSILSDFDVSIFHNFIVSDYMDIEKDEKFIDALQVHLDSIGKYKIAVQQIILYNADFTGNGTKNSKIVKDSLLKESSVFKKEIEDCLVEIKKL